MSSRRRKKKKTTSVRAKLIVLLILFACIFIVFMVRRSEIRKERAVVNKGISFLNSVDSDEALASTEKVIKEQRQDAITQLLSKAAEEGSEESFDPWGYFSDSVIMGDSRAVGFYLFEYLPENRTIAAAGNTIETITDAFKDLEAINPSYVFLCYGLNDITSGRWETPEDWIKDYDSQLKKLKKKFPDTTVVINSILPTTKKALSTSERVKLIPDYAQALRDYCEKNDVLFVDCDQLAANHEDMVDVDGIHYKKEFYPYWAAEMIVTAYIGDDDEAAKDIDEAAAGETEQ